MRSESRNFQSADGLHSAHPKVPNHLKRRRNNRSRAHDQQDDFENKKNDVVAMEAKWSWSWTRISHCRVSNLRFDANEDSPYRGADSC
ncbi:hypothetical protein TNCV_3726011 [Trichonephila clavipes]|nr:hypothetical protein TNCV_3726011 [Trichonephila clavipes]